MIEIYVPIKIISEANNTDHWRKKHKRRKEHLKHLANLFPSNLLPLPVTITFTRVAPRRLDSDNLVFSMKYFRDYVASQFIKGLAPGRADDDERLSFKYDQRRGEPKEYALIITIEKT